MKTIKFFTLGCKVNQYDTQKIREQFLSAGFKEENNARPANICLINTCTVTHRADSDSLNLIRRAKRENPKAKIIVTGCLAELDSKKIEGADFIVKNKSKGKIVNLLQGLSPKGTVPVTGISDFQGHTRAFVKIQDGCDNFCSYCKIPLVRGRSLSRPKNDIIAEVNRLVERGFKEIVLTGICLGSYSGLSGLIEGLEKIEGLLRIRLSSIEAGDVSDGLINKISESEKLCRHLHIPIQSGDDEILKKMNRKYNRAGYLSLIKKIKRKIPGMAITTDVLVGFPGESEKNFSNTLDLIKKIMPLKVHIFPYSSRPGTVAAGFVDPPIKAEIIKERIRRLQKVAGDCKISFEKNFLGRTMPVLFESRVKNKLDFWQGYTDNYLKVRVKSKTNLRNLIQPVKLSSASLRFSSY